MIVWRQHQNDMKVSKNSKYQTHKKSMKLTKNPNDRTGAPGALKGGPFCIFQHPLLQNIKKLNEDPLMNFFSKRSLNAEKIERGPFGIFQHPSVAKHQKIEGGPFEDFFSKEKSHSAEKTETL